MMMLHVMRPGTEGSHSASIGAHGTTWPGAPAADRVGELLGHLGQRGDGVEGGGRRHGPVGALVGVYGYVVGPIHTARAREWAGETRAVRSA